ncbi:hypothetical protein LPB140_00800 [Sphingorhabdus lutea]|uniref:TraB/GumN family protein n=1 Tax=Sphingorhabdus lutea TaxID=1913578 RepID=A0A1L3J908_9SPHN|nr:TraB/GumN family protein [Sphingorhabdus lutea]APG61619.1 hypothetical protein LPB140_00800 [Sphingorhabdus lutea]
MNKKRILIILSMIIAIFAVAYYAWSSYAVPKEEMVAGNRSGTPALWKISHKDDDKAGHAYLFGTVHLLPDGINWRSASIEQAMEDSDILYVEVVGLEDTDKVAKIFTEMGIKKGLPPIEKRIDPKLKPKFDMAMKDVPVPAFVLDNMKSWTAALTIASASSAKLGLKQDQGVDHILIAQFTSQQKPIMGLEKLEEQFGFFDSLNEEKQREMLNSVLSGTGKSREGFEKLMTAWLKGDVSGLLSEKGDDMLSVPEIREKLLDGRNRNWVNILDKQLQNNQKIFVGVGAAHLAGDKGVVQLLADKGYKVERVQ